MSDRYRVLSLGEIVEVDDPRREPRLIASRSWRDRWKDSTAQEFSTTGGPELPWDGPEWGEIVADCDCPDCRAQRAMEMN